MFKSITIDSSSSKKARQVPGPDSPSKPTPPTPTAVVASDSDEKASSTDDIPYHKMRKPFVVSGKISGESFKCLNLSFLYPNPTYVPNQKEMSELLRCIPSFTEMESLVQEMGTLFPITQWIPIEMDEDPSQSFMTRLLYGITDIVIAHIIHMKDYTAFETTKVVSHPYLFHLWLF